MWANASVMAALPNIGGDLCPNLLPFFRRLERAMEGEQKGYKLAIVPSQLKESLELPTDGWSWEINYGLYSLSPKLIAI